MEHSKIHKYHDVRWDDFRAFAEIARSASINRAAKVLGVTQSALGKRLSRLEQSLGVRLIDRGPTGTHLTGQGERVYARVLVAQNELSRAAVEAHVARSRIEGNCSLLMSDGLANHWLSQFLPIFLDRYPNIELKIILDHDGGRSHNETFDIRLHGLKPVDESQIMRPLAAIHFMPYASRVYLGKHGTPSSIADLAHHRLLDQSQHLITGPWSSWIGDDVLGHTSLFTNQNAFLARCVIEGAGIALMPTYWAIGDASLVPLDLGMELPTKLYANYNRDRASSQPVKTALAFLRQVVFNAKHMPWFDDKFQLPEPDWSAKLARAKIHISEAPAAHVPVAPVACVPVPLPRIAAPLKT